MFTEFGVGEQIIPISRGIVETLHCFSMHCLKLLKLQYLNMGMGTKITLPLMHTQDLSHEWTREDNNYALQRMTVLSSL